VTGEIGRQASGKATGRGTVSRLSSPLRHPADAVSAEHSSEGTGLAAVQEQVRSDGRTWDQKWLTGLWLWRVDLKDWEGLVERRRERIHGETRFYSMQGHASHKEPHHEGQERSRQTRHSLTFSKKHGGVKFDFPEGCIAKSWQEGGG